MKSLVIVNIFTKLSGSLLGMFSLGYLFLWGSNPNYSSIWFLIYSLGCAYAALSVFFKQLPLTPTLVFSVWFMLDQTKVIVNKPLYAVLNIAIVLPIFFYAWNKRGRNNK